MDLVSSVISAVAKAETALGSLVIDATLYTNVPGTYSTSTGSVTNTSSSHTVKCVIDKFDYTELTNTQVLGTDLKVLMFVDSVTPTVKDTITINSQSYDILAVTTQFAGPTPVLFTLQCRK